MLREQFILPQPMKSRPVESDRPVKESRSSRDSNTRREDFQSTLAATGKERQSGNHRADDRELSQTRSSNLRNEQPRDLNANRSRQTDLDKAEQRAAIAEQIDSKIKNPEIREKLKSALLGEDTNKLQSDGSLATVELTTPDLEQKLANLMDGLDLGNLTEAQAESLVTQLNALIQSLQNVIEPGALEQPIQNSLFGNANQSAELESSASIKADLAEQINTAIAELVELLKSGLHNSKSVEADTSQVQGVNSSQADKSVSSDTGSLLGSQLRLGENAQSISPDLLSVQNKPTAPSEISTTNANAAASQNKSSDSLAWLNGVMAQAEHVKSAASLSQQFEATQVDKVKPNESVQGLADLAKLALDNAKQLNLNESQISKLKAMLMGMDASVKSQSGELNAAQQQTYMELTKLIEQAQKSGQLPIAQSKSTEAELATALGRADATQQGPINQAFKASQLQNQAVNVNSQNSDNSSQKIVLENISQTGLSNAEQESEGGKFKLAEQIQVQMQSTSAAANLLQPNSESVVKTQTVEVQGVQIDRTLQAPKMESITNIRHDAMLKENILFNKQELANAMQQQVGLMMARNMKSVDIRLDPPELGSMQIRLNIGAEAASVNFVVSSQQAKDALEGSLPRLKEMLEQQGMQLADSNVKKDNSGNGQQGEGEQSLNGQSGLANQEGDEGQSKATNEQTQMAYQIDSPYKIDFYA